MVLNSQFWRDKRVLVTGHTGFKGSWLFQFLKNLGAEPFGFSLQPNTDPNLYQLLQLDRDSKQVLADIRDLAAVKKFAREVQPEIVFHLAAQALVHESYRQPIETLGSNIMGTAHILEALREGATVRAVVIVTTDKCYENREWEWPYRETDRLGGHDPYAASKACAELVTASYFSSFFRDSNCGIATARAGNVIGGGDFSRDRLLPDLYRAIAGSVPLEVRNPHHIRPWQHVLDALSGYLILAQNLYSDRKVFSQAFNFGPRPENSLNVGDVLKIAQAHLKFNVKYAQSGSGPNGEFKGFHETKHLILDSSRAHQMLGWKCKLSTSMAIEKTCLWYESYLKKQDFISLMNQQMSDYIDTGF